jgi:hypothetical protein
MTQVREEKAFQTTLNLVADEGQLQQGVLTLANGVRPKTLGAITSRQGRVQDDYSIEGYTGEVVTDESLPPVTNAGALSLANGMRVSYPPIRGYTPFYDQRLAWTDPNTHPNLENRPEIINHIYKADGKVWFNISSADEGGQLTGDGDFQDNNTVAKFWPYEDRVFAIDESSEPKIIERAPKADQTHGGVVNYEISRMGIAWPNLNTLGAGDTEPLVSGPQQGAAADDVPAGVYRVRIALENKFGRVSGPGLPGSHTVAEHLSSVPINIFVQWGTIAADFPAEATHVRIYLQYTEDFAVNAERSAYHFVQRVAIGGGNNFTILKEHWNNRINQPIMSMRRGYPPKLRDITVINDVAYGIATNDRIVRETLLQDGGKRLSAEGTTDYSVEVPTYLGDVQFEGTAKFKVYENTQLTEMTVDPSYLFIAEPGAPEYMEDWVQIGEGREHGIGVAPLGDKCAIFTDKAIYIFDSVARVMRKAFSHIGCLSRDSIASTEQGIYFMGADGVPRLFNGATVQVVGRGVEPLFAKRFDQVNHDVYKKLDHERPAEVISASGNNVLLMTYPNQEPGDQRLARDLLVMGTSDPFPLAIDTQAYDWVHHLSREGRLLAVGVEGQFYYLEEGAQGDADVTFGGTGEVDFDFNARIRKLGTSFSTQWYKFELEFDSGGRTLTVKARVDDDPSLTQEYEVQSTGRVTRTLYLPAHYKGRYIDFEFTATVAAGRITVYRLHVEEMTRGVI